MADNFHNKVFYAGNTPQPMPSTPDGGQQMGDYFAWRQVAGALRSEYEKYGPEGFERRHGVPWEEVERMISDALSNAPNPPHYNFMAPPNNTPPFNFRAAPEELRNPERDRNFMAPPEELRRQR